MAIDPFDTAMMIGPVARPTWTPPLTFVPGSTVHLIIQAKSRLVEIRRQLAQVESLAAEAATLSRMIDAAEHE